MKKIIIIFDTELKRLTENQINFIRKIFNEKIRRFLYTI